MSEKEEKLRALCQLYTSLVEAREYANRYGDQSLANLIGLIAAIAEANLPSVPTDQLPPSLKAIRGGKR